MAEQDNQYFQLPKYGRTQDLATSKDKAFTPTQAPHSHPKEKTAPVIPPDVKPSTLSPEAPAWLPTKMPRPATAMLTTK